MEKKLELRMYFFTNYQLTGMQKGIRTVQENLQKSTKTYENL